MAGKTTSMVVDLKPGECIALQDGLVTVELVHKSGQLARLRITAPPEVAIRKQQEGRGTIPQGVPSMVS